ncbi:MAG: tetratricopeptide repeat protein [Spirochaetia bacterium]|nr:tetratricopeptide repeat protein [Spirochaetia bacterium]
MANDAMSEVEELKRKLGANPDSLIFVPLADAYRKVGMLQEAIDVCTKGLEKHPGYMSARVVLGRVYIEKEMFDEALEELKKVALVDIDNIMVHSMLGNVYIKKKMYPQAVEQFQRVLSLNPEDTETQEKLQEALSAKQSPDSKPAGKKEEPEKEADKTAKKEEPVKPAVPQLDVAKSLKAAELYTKKEEFEKAIEIYKEILDRDPGNIMIEQRLREVYDFQDKKRAKDRAKAAEAAAAPAKKPSADKITVEDIFDVMKKAVEDDRVEEEATEAAPAAKLSETAKIVKPAEPKEEEKTAAEAAKPAPKPNLAKSKELEAVLAKFSEVEGMVGSFYLLRDGTILASVLPKSINAADIGKTIATIVAKTESSVRNMNQGKLNQVVISSESGQLLFTEVMNGVLFMIGNENINVGKMRLMLRDVIEHIKNALK